LKRRKREVNVTILLHPEAKHLKMTVEEELSRIQESLKPKPHVRRIPVEAKSADAKAVDVTTALLKLPLILVELSKLTREKQREVDAVEMLQDLELTVQKQLGAVEANLKATQIVDARLKRRVDSLDVVEAKWNLVIGRVNSVLDELERVLKQL